VGENGCATGGAPGDTATRADGVLLCDKMSPPISNTLTAQSTAPATAHPAINQRVLGDAGRGAGEAGCGDDAAVGLVGEDTTGYPHASQKRMSGNSAAPHCAQRRD